MPTVDSSRFKKRIREKILKIKLAIPKIMKTWGEEVYADVESGSDLLVPSWKAAFKADGTGQYFKPIGQGGLFDAIRQSKFVSVEYLKNDINRVGIGSKSMMDAATMGQQGYPYWRLFEYGSLGSRAGGSSDMGFVPFANGGYMDKVSPGGRAKRPHPGVLPVFLFSDTFFAKKKVLKNRIRFEVEKIIREK